MRSGAFAVSAKTYLKVTFLVDTTLLVTHSYGNHRGAAPSSNAGFAHPVFSLAALR